MLELGLVAQNFKDSTVRETAGIRHRSRLLMIRTKGLQAQHNLLSRTQVSNETCSMVCQFSIRNVNLSALIIEAHFFFSGKVISRYSTSV
jgi:hypothetical protein